MPLYEYRCTKCQSIMEVIQGFKDPPPKKCEKCGGSKLEKVISRSGFVLKGSGWYQTDYKPAPKSDSKSESKSESSSDSADTKPASDSPKEAPSKKKPKGSSAS